MVNLVTTVKYTICTSGLSDDDAVYDEFHIRIMMCPLMDVNIGACLLKSRPRVATYRDCNNILNAKTMVTDDQLLHRSSISRSNDKFEKHGWLGLLVKY